MSVSDVTDANKCPECGSQRLYVDSHRAEVVCAECSAVVAEAMVEQGGPSLEGHRSGDDSRLLPQLFYSSRDTEGRLVAGDTVWKLRQTAKMQNLRSSERAVLNFESRLRQLAEQRGIPDSVVKRATDMYHRVRERKTFNKPNLTELALGLLLTACREMRHLIMYKDLVRGTSPPASMNKVKKYYRTISVALGLGRPGSDALVNRLGEMSVNQQIAYFAAKLGVARRGQVLSEAASTVKLSDGWVKFEIDKTPGAAHCVAAAALFIALKNGGSKISQRDYCAKVNLSEINLRGWVAKLGGYENRKFEPERVRLDELDGP